MVLRIVTVDTRAEVSRAEVGDDGAVTYHGGTTAAAVVRSWRLDHPDASETDAIAALASEGWSNGYLMVALAE